MFILCPFLSVMLQGSFFLILQGNHAMVKSASCATIVMVAAFMNYKSYMMVEVEFSHLWKFSARCLNSPWTLGGRVVRSCSITEINVPTLFSANVGNMCKILSNGGYMLRLTFQIFRMF